MPSDQPATLAPELLDAALIRSQLEPSALALLTELDLHGPIDSTNSEAMRRASAGAGSGLVCSAEQQLAGRGRRGRDWVSPYASNIYLSLVWEFQGGAAAVEGLSLAVGVAVVEALSGLGIEDMRLKWPNDILYENAKLGGILVEMSAQPSGSCKVVIGIGLNVSMPMLGAVDIDQDWTDLSRIVQPPPSRNLLLAALLNQLLPLLPAFEAHGFAPWQPLWAARDAYPGTAAVIHNGTQQVAGTLAGIDQGGALLLDVNGVVQRFIGGEISVRPVS